MADKIRENNQYLFQKAAYPGVGNPDTSRDEFIANIHKDTLASLAMHESSLLYQSVATNTHPELMRQQLIKKAASGRDS